MGKIIHYPNLQTVLMVETILKKEKDITRTELKKKLPKKIMHQTLNVIIKYLEDSGKIIDHRQGILWTYKSPDEMEELLRHTSPFTPEDFRIPGQYTHKKRQLSRNDETGPRRKATTSRVSAHSHQKKRKNKQRISRTVAVNQ
ncbi:TPA: hypothetical protein HA251_05345 [Candidatus Woesearchaeota archaeon]|nr:hypothetical protein [Candidatus Woesearchaeota archaeon]